MEKYIELLRMLISTPSLSRSEGDAAKVIRQFLKGSGHTYFEKLNNTWVKNQYWKEGLPVILLNSHIDTVKPANDYTRDPFSPDVEDGVLYGLGSNDAGGPLVTLLSVFDHFSGKTDLPFNLIFAASAEEEVSGANGMEIVLPELGKIDLAIVGEPTMMQMAIAEKGLMVLDCVAHGKSGHAARDEGENAIYKAIADIERIRNFKFEKASEILGPVKMTVTMIEAGSQHNVVPDRCKFVVDVRTNEFYSNEAAFEVISGFVESEVVPRSFRLNSSGIPIDHPVVQKGISIGVTYYGSPTTSDQALISYPSIKMGPGDSARSHTANEFIRISELEEGFEIFVKLLSGLKI